MIQVLIQVLIESLDTSSLDNEIKEQTDDIKQLVVRLGYLLTNKERARITTE